MKRNGTLLLAVVLFSAIAITLALSRRTRAQVMEVLIQLSHLGSHHDDERPPDRSWVRAAATPNTPWDRTLTLTDDQVRSIGLKTVAVKQQTEPTTLKLFGSTEYDPATVTVVRTQFDSRVDRVLVDLNQPVKIGQPLLELFSTDLAEAKSNYERDVSQWVHDKKVLDYKTPLAIKDTIPRKELIEAENDEAQSRLKMKLSKDKLLVYGLTDAEIEHASTEDGVQKAKMILRSRASGVVVQRSVVTGNYYTSADMLMTIAPLDHLWVRGSVSELDVEKVAVGQKVKVIFPFSDQTLESTVAYIDKAIDSETRAAKFRVKIGNPDGGLKAAMFVRMMLDIAPKPGRTVIPRSAMVSVDRFEYVFIKEPDAPARFSRRRIFVAKENNDIVIVAEPSADHPELTPGQEVVTNGSLILQQMYENRLMTEGDLLLARNLEKHPPAFDDSTPVISTTPTQPH
jgi:cobalt-zinc-cadmium efflux system membrane fusion protein